MNAKTVALPSARGALTLAAFAAVALLLTMLISPALARHDTPGPAVEPTLVAGNPTCPEGTTEIKFEGDLGEIEVGTTKVVMIGSTTVRVEILATDGFSVTFDVDNALAAHVFVKAGDDANHYDYSTLAAGGIRHDDGLMAPTNDGQQQPAISHVSFCLVLAAGEESASASMGDDHASLNIKKVNEDGSRLAGAVFTIEGMPGTFTTADDGTFCILGLPADSMWLVTEIQAPPGYDLADPAWQTVEVDDDGDCDSPDAVFVNTAAEESMEASVDESAAASASVDESAAASASVDESAAASVEGSVLGGVGTPAPSTPDTAMGAGNGPSPLPILAFGAIVLASLAGLAWVNVQAVRSRN
jgi:hypothetical protein